MNALYLFSTNKQTKPTTAKPGKLKCAKLLTLFRDIKNHKKLIEAQFRIVGTSEVGATGKASTAPQ